MRQQEYLMRSLVLVASVLFFSALPSDAQNEAATYKSKCVVCHGADGSGSEVGKKLGVRDFHSSEVKGESEAELAQIIGKGKDKMPAYEKLLKPDEIKGLAAYVQQLSKK
jgi:cytochrome c6